MLDSMRAPILRLKGQVVGRTAVKLEGDRTICRVQECNLGTYI